MHCFLHLDKNFDTSQINAKIINIVETNLLFCSVPSVENTSGFLLLSKTIVYIIKNTDHDKLIVILYKRR